MRNFALWLHILGGATWFGANVAQAVIGPKMMRDDAGGAVWLRAVEKASGPIYGGAATAILATGIYLVLGSNGAYSFGSAFVGIGIAILIIGGALAGLVFGRKARQMIALYDSGNTSGVAGIYRSLRTWGVIDTLLLAVAVLAMVSKWGA
ncbi:MAG: hypothetical protein ACREA0_29750 [bacterium]